LPEQLPLQRLRRRASKPPRQLPEQRLPRHEPPLPLHESEHEPWQRRANKPPEHFEPEQRLPRQAFPPHWLPEQPWQP